MTAFPSPLASAAHAEAIIPGEPEALFSDALALRRLGGVLSEKAHSVTHIDLTPWSGETARKYGESAALLAAKLTYGADVVDQAASVLTTHAGVVSWAQERVEECLHNYRQAASAPACVPPFQLGLQPGLTPDQQAAVARFESVKATYDASVTETADALNRLAELGIGGPNVLAVALGLSKADANPWHVEGAVAAGATASLAMMAVGPGEMSALAKSAEAEVMIARVPRATLGESATANYKGTFFQAHPELEGKVVVHHAVEQQVFRRYPDIVTRQQMHSLENLRGIPSDINPELHLSALRKEWNSFYRTHPTASVDDLLDHATYLDAKYGTQFRPAIEGAVAP